MQASAAIRFLVEGFTADVGGLISVDVWNAELRRMDSAKSPAVDCPCCGRREFPFLSHANGDFTTTLCGRNTIQVQMRRGSVDLAQAAKKLAGVGSVQTSPWFIRCQLRDPAGIELTLFPDSRLLVKGTSDPLRAKSVYSRFVGS
jgi:adenylyltransferase/sulfurtransferase